ncbi:MAG: hypothetical protein DWQ06_09025 [Calditrichaeota bacterium]|nr:MAG: hypothetical protein DWQ06_09025 [Calditrichota bacterium]
MKTSKLKLTATLLVLFLVGFVSYSMKAYAQPGFGKGFKGEKRVEHRHGIEHKIPDLTESQKDQIEKLRTEHMKKTLPMKNEVGEKEARLRTLTTAENVNMSKVNSVIEDIGELKTKMAKEREAHRQEIRKLLNDKQRVMFDSFPPRKPHGPKNKSFGRRGGRR